MAGRFNKDLTRLTDAERWWLCRVRHALNQIQWAEQVGVGREYISMRENGRRSGPPPLPLPRKLPVPLLLALARRRARLSSRAMARRLGVSHVTVLAMERRGDAALVRWWRAKGCIGISVVKPMKATTSSTKSLKQRLNKQLAGRQL